MKRRDMLTGPATGALPSPQGLRPDPLRPAVEELHRWYLQQARVLPWRATRDAYAIWISEVMLQQTQVRTVVPYYERWLAALPTVRALAAADEAEVLRLWEGLGYYSRARNLHRAARELVARFDGSFPRDPAHLRTLPGIGPYTVAAVASLAFGAPLAVVDANVRRVLSRLLALEEEPRRAPVARRLEALAHELLADHDPSRHNQAMMELGALVCLPRSPRCEVCPLLSACAAAATGEPSRFPPARPTKVVPHQAFAVALVGDGERLLLEQRPAGGLLAGLWDLPSHALALGEEPPGRLAGTLRELYGLEVAVEASLPLVKHAYSHLKVTLHAFRCRLRGGSSRAAESVVTRIWVRPEELDQRAMPRACHKVLEGAGLRAPRG